MRRLPLAALSLALLPLLAGVGWWLSQPEPPEVGSGTPSARRTVLTRTGGDAELERAVVELDALYGERRGYLTPEETEALKRQRSAAAEAIAARIGAGDAAVVAATLDRIRTTEASREKLVLIAGLGRNPSAEAVAALGAVYEEAELFRLREEALRALGRSEGPGHAELLVRALGADDAGLSQIAAMALYGEAEAVSDLASVASSPYGEINTRLEAVSSLGGVQEEESLAALEQIRDDDGLEPRVRQYAERVIERR